MLAGTPLLPVAFDLAEYNGRLAALQQAPMAGAPPSLLPSLRAMMAQSPSLRPPAASFTATGYFQVGDSWRVPALRDPLLNFEFTSRTPTDNAKCALLHVSCIIWCVLTQETSPSFVYEVMCMSFRVGVLPEG